MAGLKEKYMVPIIAGTHFATVSYAVYTPSPTVLGRSEFPMTSKREYIVGDEENVEIFTSTRAFSNGEVEVQNARVRLRS